MDRSFSTIALFALLSLLLLWYVHIDAPESPEADIIGGDQNIILAPGESIYSGYYTFGHEVRTFRACDFEGQEFWVSGDSPMSNRLRQVYEAEMKDVPPALYAPLFVVLVGNFEDAPEDGFGANYDRAFRATDVMRISRTESCKSEDIIVSYPLTGEGISSPLGISGMARGTWFFEGDFPVILTDWDGKIIAEGYVSANGDWMTEEYVPFMGKLEFEAPAALASGAINRGALILKKDNPSGLPNLDDALEIPVHFKE